KESFNHPYTFVAAQTGLDEKTVRDIFNARAEFQSVMAAGRHRRGCSAMPAPLGAPGRLIDYGGAAGVVAARLLVPGPVANAARCAPTRQ
ncbi:MAG: hypothetical protein CML18_13680, partial [Pusillimonas sp.]|nr:hypothetical protein [Pusillimonas sp.]